MDSSIKYQKFAVSEVDDETKSGKLAIENGSKTQIIGVLLLIATVCGIIVAVGVGVGVSVSISKNGDPESETSDGLTVITLTQDELEGEYHGSDTGIHFQSTMNETSFTLAISTTNGVPVVVIIRPLVSNMTLMRASSTNFMVMENQPGHVKYDGYVVPNDTMNLLKSILMGHGKMSDNVLKLLDNQTVNETLHFVFNSIAMSEEALLIIKAAEALNSLGVQGSEYPAVMRFYLLALRLAKARHIGEDNFEFRAVKEPRRMQTRATKYIDGHICIECPYKQGTNNCFGRCGPGCTCWDKICGDCCVHEYCRTHDQCCEDKGFYSFACLSVVWKVLGSMCSEKYDC